MRQVCLEVSIVDPADNEVGHKRIEIRPPNVSHDIHEEGVVFDDWVPSGSSCKVTIYRGSDSIYTEKKLIPNAFLAQEGADVASFVLSEGRDMLRSILGAESRKGQKTVQPFKHRIDVWVRFHIDENGSGDFECHVGNPGENERKAVFQTRFKS
jgi:hypothetical protein